MKWFKHQSDSSRSSVLSKIYQEFGLEGEARWWRLMELMAEQWPTDDGSFRFTSATIRRHMMLRSATDSRPFVDLLATCTGMKVEWSGNDCRIIYDKITELKDNHTRNLQVASKLLASDLALDKIRTDKTRKDKSRGDKSNDTTNNNKYLTEDDIDNLEQFVDEAKIFEKFPYMHKSFYENEILAYKMWLSDNPSKRKTRVKSKTTMAMINWFIKKRSWDNPPDDVLEDTGVMLKIHDENDPRYEDTPMMKFINEQLFKRKSDEATIGE